MFFLDQNIAGDRVLDVLDRLFHGLPLADAAWQTDGFGHVTFIFFIAAASPGSKVV
jgi:hypothetical protein